MRNLGSNKKPSIIFEFILKIRFDCFGSNLAWDPEMVLASVWSIEVM